MKNKTEGALRSLKSTLLVKIQEVRSEQNVKNSQILKTAIFAFWSPSIFDFDMYQKKGSNFQKRGRSNATHLKYKYNFQPDTNTIFILGEIIRIVEQIRRVQK